MIFYVLKFDKFNYHLKNLENHFLKFTFKTIKEFSEIK